jgi:hypothetical protein
MRLLRKERSTKIVVLLGMGASSGSILDDVIPDGARGRLQAIFACCMQFLHKALLYQPIFFLRQSSFGMLGNRRNLFSSQARRFKSPAGARVV